MLLAGVSAYLAAVNEYETSRSGYSKSITSKGQHYDQFKAMHVCIGDVISSADDHQ